MNYDRASIAGLGLALSVGVFAFPVGLLAQQAALDSSERVIVLARKRSEDSQAIPEAITVFGESAIDRFGIESMTDFAALTPNLSAYGNFRPNLTNITIRGLTSTQLGEPPIAFIVDGVTVPNLEFMNQGLIDIEQIEVIRGPQGALYGKNAIGGAVNIVTRAPSEEMEVVLRGAAGEGSDLHLNATASGPLSGKAVFRVSGFFRDFDGLIDDTFNGHASDFVEESGVQGLLGFDLTDRTYIDFRVRYTRGDYGLGYYENVDFDTLTDESITPAHNVLPIDENTLTHFSAKLEHEVGAGSLVVIAGYDESEDENFLDADFSAFPPDFDNFFFPGGQFSLIDDAASSLEARFVSPSDGRFRWLVGAYYQDRERDNDFDIYDDPIGTVVRDRASFADELLFEIVRDRQKSRAFALFGQGNYDLSDALELTLALRYDEDRREGLDPRDPQSFAERTFDKWQPKASLAWQVTGDFLAYATLARSFRTGGFNEVAPTVTRIFEAETADTAEIGIKWLPMNGMLSLNAAYFETDRNNAQYTRFNPVTFSLEQLTIDEVGVSGIEVELGFSPTDSLELLLGYGDIDDEIRRFDPAAFESPPTGIVGNSMPRVADWSGNLSITHTANLGSSMDFVTSLSANWLGKRSFDLENTLVDGNATYLNLAVGIETESWTVRLRGSNLLDRLEPEDAFIGIASPVARFRNQPRQILLETTYSLK